MKKTSSNLIRLSDFDIHLCKEGTHLHSYQKLGAHLVKDSAGTQGVHFAVWAPNAKSVSLIGDFNAWNKDSHILENSANSGIWEIFVPGLQEGECYKYYVTGAHSYFAEEKSDPYAFYAEVPPRTASRVWDLDNYTWRDQNYYQSIEDKNPINEPILIYEVHLGSWRRTLSNETLSYQELAYQLRDYVLEMGFTHVELLPIMEHPFDGSWGYQTTGYFAPTSRFGSPNDFKEFIDVLHEAGIGIILDWTPAHFPDDPHALAYFDGSHLYEHADPKQGKHPDWGTLIFQYGRNEVKNFLISNALFWLKEYHIDALRVDAVASMLYLDYSREAGEWIPNQYGGRENIEAIDFMKTLNETVYAESPTSFTVAEESTAWPMVSRPTSCGGLGFGFKWNMGWMNDTLNYFSRDPIHRSYHHNELTFSMIYAFHENFILPISHDEVVHGKGSVLNKMPGDIWQKFSNARLLYSYMYAHPGKKLLFQGTEFGQWEEWNHDKSLDWHLMDFYHHMGLSRLVQDLNHLVRDQPALHQLDCSPEGFEWIDCSDATNSVIAFIRKNKDNTRPVIIVFNLTPVARMDYRIGAPWGGTWQEIFNSDSEYYAGSNLGNQGFVQAEEFSWHGKSHSLVLNLPPLGGAFFTPA